MTGFLVLFALIAAIVWFTVSRFRSRVQSSLQRAQDTLPPELQQQLSAMRAKGAAVATPAQIAARPAMVAAAPRPATPPTPGAVPALHFMLIYDVAPDFVARRADYRAEHLALAWKAADAGGLVLAGALEEGTGQAFLLFRGTREAAQRFALADPYVRHGLVRQWQVRQWHTVVGAGAAMPMRPDAAKL